jgi:ketosteroid isomerase-like protein
MPTNRQITQGVYEAFSKGDVPSVLAVMDDKIEWTEAEGSRYTTAPSWDHRR